MVCLLHCLGVLEQALGGIPLDLGMVVKRNLMIESSCIRIIMCVFLGGGGGYTSPPSLNAASDTIP